MYLPVTIYQSEGHRQKTSVCAASYLSLKIEHREEVCLTARRWWWLGYNASAATYDGKESMRLLYDCGRLTKVKVNPLTTAAIDIPMVRLCCGLSRRFFGCHMFGTRLCSSHWFSSAGGYWTSWEQCEHLPWMWLALLPRTLRKACWLETIVCDKRGYQADDRSSKNNWPILHCKNKIYEQAAQSMTWF